VEDIGGVETITVAAGFPWSDFEDVGLSIIVTTNDDQGLADRCADELSGLVWGLRRDFLVKPTPVREALEKVKRRRRGPSSSPTSGTTRGAAPRATARSS